MSRSITCVGVHTVLYMCARFPHVQVLVGLGIGFADKKTSSDYPSDKAITDRGSELWSLLTKKGGIRWAAARVHPCIRHMYMFKWRPSTDHERASALVSETWANSTCCSKEHKRASLLRSCRWEDRSAGERLWRQHGQTHIDIQPHPERQALRLQRSRQNDSSLEDSRRADRQNQGLQIHGQPTSHSPRHW
jgi:hypothetical protein